VGLSEYEAKVYVSLVKIGTAKARTLSMISGVPRTKVYSVLKKLIDSGLVIEIPEEPRRFAPTPPKTAFGSYLRSYQNMVENLLSIVSSLEEVFKKAKNKGRPQRGTIWIINGRQEILRKIREMLSKANRSVCLVTDENGMILLYKAFNRLLDDLAERSVKVKIMTPCDFNNQHILSELRYTCEIEENDFQLPLIFLCTDEKQLLLANLQPSSLSSKSESIGFFSEDPVLREMISLLISGKVDAYLYHPMTSKAEETC